MACLTEALGMSLPDCGTTLAVMAKKRHIAYASGERIVELVREGLTPRKILTPGAFENAIRLDLALGGSSNTVLHLCAIAREAGVELDLARFDEPRAGRRPSCAACALPVSTSWRTSIPPEA